MHNSPETKVIRQRMEEVRRDLDEDVQEIVEGTRGMGQWRTYVTSYPWLSVGAAFAVGYVIVPRVLGMQPLARTRATSHSPPKGKARGLLLTFAGNLLMRGVTSLVGQQAGKLLAARAAKSPQDHQA